MEEYLCWEMEEYLCGENTISKENCPKINTNFHFLNGNDFPVVSSDTRFLDPYNIAMGIYFHHISFPDVNYPDFFRMAYHCYLIKNNKTIRDILKKN